jgi:hypothetical protein
MMLRPLLAAFKEAAVKPPLDGNGYPRPLSRRSSHARRQGVGRCGDGERPMCDTRPSYPNDIRDLPPALARVAIFTVAVGPEEDRRSDADNIIAGCEGGSCILTTREPPK